MSESAAAPAADRCTATATPSWEASRGLVAAGMTIVVLVGAGLLLSRIDLALFAMPLLLGVVWSRASRPRPPGTVTAAITLAQAGAAEIRYSVAIDAPTGVEAIVVRCATLGGVTFEGVLAGPSSHGIGGRVALLHSGPLQLVRVDHRLLGPDAATVSRPAGPLHAGRVVSPAPMAIRRLPLPRRLQGLTGTHESVRAGDGGDFRDVHPFAPGDRLRRIDWKATARRGQNAGDLYVRRTAALADTTVLIVLDSRDDVGEQVAHWSDDDPATKGISALDLAREAASSLAAAYVRAGDRVGFQDLSSRRGMIPHGGGTRHLWRLLRTIESVAPAPVALRHRRPPIVPPGALVYLLSSLLDDASVTLALRWRGGGHRVIAVDVLPAPRLTGLTERDRVAHRIVMMQRADRLRTLQAGGVELLRWSDDGAALPRHARLDQLARPPREAGGAGARR